MKSGKLLKNTAKPPRWPILFRAAARGGAKSKIRSSYFQYTPPKKTAENCSLPFFSCKKDNFGLK